MHTCAFAMSEPQALRCRELLNLSYASVRHVLHRDPLKLLQRATTVAPRASPLIANVRAEVAGVELGVDVRVLACRIARDAETDSNALPIARIQLWWEAVRTPGLFPTMLAEVSAQPVSPDTTRLEIEGTYWPPFGPLGKAIDAAVGHRVAEAAVHRLLTDIAVQLREECREWTEGGTA
jgi:hypothetical protein